MFIAIASSSPPLLPIGQAEQLVSSPSPTFLYGARICAWMNISPGSLSCNPKNDGGTSTAMEESQLGVSPASKTGECTHLPSCPTSKTSPSISPPPFPHYETLEKFFRPSLGPGEALQINPGTWRNSSNQPLDLDKHFRTTLEHLLASFNSHPAHLCLQTVATQGRSCLLPHTVPG